MVLFPPLISLSQSNTKLTLIENKKKKKGRGMGGRWRKKKKSWNKVEAFGHVSAHRGNLKGWNVELERIWCVSNWTEGDTVGGVRTFRRYLSNVLWHVWGVGGKGIEMRDLCRRLCRRSGFISFLPVGPSGRAEEKKTPKKTPKKQKQADIQADSDHTENVCLSYLDIHSKHLNQVVLNGPHPPPYRKHRRRQITWFA